MENILEEISKASIRFLSPLTLSETYKVVTQEAMKLVNAEYGSIYLYINDSLIRVYASSKKLHATKARKSGYTYRSFITQKPDVIDTEKIKDVHPEIKKMGIKSTILIPLSYQGIGIGVLSVDSSKTKQFSGRELHVLKLFGQMASLAIKKNQLHDETQRALESRDLFISLASHELRTPITSINGYIQLLYDRLGKEESVESQWIRDLYGENMRLTKLVKELLEINRIKQGQLQFVFEECHIADMLQESIEKASLLYTGRKIELKHTFADKQDIVIGDCNKLLQMFSSIISNAVKFSDSSSLVEITAKAIKNAFVIQVKDEGVGIPNTDLKRVFDGFYKTKSSLQAQKEGLGIGLMLAKHIAASHKGSISIHSKEQKGTTVEVRLPRVHYEK